MGKTPFHTLLNDHALFLRDLAAKKVTLGFDGFIDSIVRVVREKNEGANDLYFETSNDFAHYILEKQSRNFSFELKELTHKLGGNMPIMANALGKLGPKINCIGTLGFPRIHRAFRHMPENCTLYGFAEPGVSTAMEFKDSKIMMAEMNGLDRVKWETIKEIIGLEKTIELFTDRDLVCILNWSEIEHSTDMWKGLLTEVLPKTTSNGTSGRTRGFFDFSDCSKKSPEKITEALQLIKDFASHWDMILSLNMNEASTVYNVLTKRKNIEIPAKVMIEEIYQSLDISGVVIHYATDAFFRNADGLHHQPTQHISEPVLLTGAGDNFNAGFCAATLCGGDADEALQMAHRVSQHYLKFGESPSLDQVLASLPTRIRSGKMA